MASQIEVLDEDIAAVGRLMNRDFSDEERKSVLRTMCSCDVQACPGSGKTTLLVAKLAILVPKIVSRHEGICVLSHTNAARIEIERSLGAYTDTLFCYPHFIGTIQAFVDQFLAIPALALQFGARPWAIDDDTYGRVAYGRFRSLSRKTQFALNQERKNIDGDGGRLLRNVRYTFHVQNICTYDNGRERPFPAGAGTPTFQDVKRLKDEITRDGCIAYYDAFCWAKWYIDQFPRLAQWFARRFPWVFIDEMQDTSGYQWEVVRAVLSSGAMLQCFGDQNQTIYSSAEYSEEQPGWQPVAPLQVSSSHRLSESIAKLSQNVCATPQTLVGNSTRPCCRHTIFLFSQNSVRNVLPAFAKLVASERLKQGPFKAVGAVGKPNADPTKLTIASYWPTFQRRRNVTGRMPYLRDHFGLAQRILVETGNCGGALDYLTNGLLELLRRNGSRPEPKSSQPYSASLILGAAGGASRSQSQSALRKQMVDWLQILTANRDIDWVACATQVRQVLVPLLGVRLTTDAEEFLSDAKGETVDSTTRSAADNRFRHLVEGQEIVIEIDTIHGVKGQNHQATLVLETCYFEHDLGTLIPYLIAEKVKKPGKRVLSRLPLAYVGMTRPTHLLCLAIQQDHVTVDQRRKLERCGWCLQEV